MYYKLTFLLFLFSLSVTGQVNYVSQSLKKIFDQLPSECRRHLIETKDCNCVLKGVDYHLRCSIDGDKLIHVGLNLFSDSLKKSNNDAIYSFIERELLKYILDDNLTRDARLKEDQVYLYYANSLQDMKQLNSSDKIQTVVKNIIDISIKQDSSKCTVLLTNSHAEKLGMKFPVINTLISGMDKKELDDYIISELSKGINTSTNTVQKNFDSFYKTEGDLLVGKGEYFLIKDFSSSRYYIREKDIIKLVYDKKYLPESFSNLFLSGMPDSNPITIDVKLKGYGYDTKINPITVDELLSHFDDQFKLYFGIEDTSRLNLRGTLILYNPNLNYLHLLDIKTNAESLFRNPGRMTGTLYPYIPTHNIKDLFGKGVIEKSILMDDILKKDDHYE